MSSSEPSGCVRFSTQFTNNSIDVGELVDLLDSSKYYFKILNHLISMYGRTNWISLGNSPLFLEYSRKNDRINQWNNSYLKISKMYIMNEYGTMLRYSRK